jgi:3-hydroxypropionyl-CoA synthetase (ADP-forming)
VIRSEDVPDMVDKCARKGVKNIVIISGGFKELGGKYIDIEAEIAKRARKYGIRIIGPNCIGVFDPRTGIDTFFEPKWKCLRPKPGNVAILTQSGTYGLILLEWAAMDHLGVSKFVSYGNKVDVDEADLLLYLLEEPHTKVIGIYMEGLSDGRKFYNALKRVTRYKPVVILRGGRTETAKLAVKSHTGFLGGGGRIYEAAFKQGGAFIAKDLEDLYDLLKALSKQPPAKGKRVAMVSNGAGLMVQAVDALEEEDLELAKLSNDTRNKLRERLSPYTVVDNPVDLTGSATDKDYQIAVELLLKDPNVDIVMVFFVRQNAPLSPNVVNILAETVKKLNTGKPVIFGAAGGPYTQKVNSDAEKLGIPVYPIPERAVRAAKALYEWGKVTVK